MQRISILLACTGLLLACPSEEVVDDWRQIYDGDGWMFSIWGSGVDNRYAVGGDLDRGVVRHYDGRRWREVTVPQNGLLTWVYGFSPTSIFVVGAAGIILHYDGASWTQMPSPTTDTLWGVWGATEAELWAVGGSGRADATPVVLRYRPGEGGWKAIAMPALARANVGAFFKVWGSAADNVYIVGQRGAVVRWDGRVWTELTLDTDEDLISIWGSSADNIVTVGSRTNGVIGVWDGSSWDTRSVSPVPALNGVWVKDETTAYVVGVTGTLLHFNPQTFALEPSTIATELDFHAVFGTADGWLTAVGGDINSFSPPFAGIAYEKEL